MSKKNPGRTYMTKFTNGAGIEYKIGDLVRVVDFNHLLPHGSLQTINNIFVQHTNDVDVFFEVADQDGNLTGGWFPTRFVKASRENRIAVGDTVRGRFDEYLFRWDKPFTGLVTNIVDGGQHVYVKWISAPSGFQNGGWDYDRFEVIKPEEAAPPAAPAVAPAPAFASNDNYERATGANVNPGDKLIFDPQGGSFSAERGALATVTGWTGNYLMVEWDRVTNKLAGSQLDGGYYPWDFRIISRATPIPAPAVTPELTKTEVTEEEKGIYVLMVRDGNSFAPAATPKVYKSLKQAKAVAYKMTEKSPGDIFTVFKAVGEATLPKVEASFTSL